MYSGTATALRWPGGIPAGGAPGYGVNADPFLERCRSGDREALQRLVEEHYGRIFRLACSMVGPQEAHDLTQETFSSALRAIDRFRGEAQISTWLISILRNRYALNLRGRRKWGHSSLEAAQGVAASETESIEPGVRSILEKVKRLPEDLRTTLLLFYLEGLKYTEIAEAMGCPIGTVRSRLFEARERLKKSLAAERAP